MASWDFNGEENLCILQYERVSIQLFNAWLNLQVCYVDARIIFKSLNSTEVCL